MGTAEMKEDLKVNKEKVSTAKIWKKRISNFFLMTAGSFCYAAAISLFLDPNNLAPGGVTGIAIILNRLFSVSTGTMIFLLNIPIMLLGFWKLGGKLIVSTLYCIALASFLTDRLGTYGAITEEPLLAALAGAVLVAVGMGGVFKAGSTTGGTDIIIKVLRLKMPHIKTGALYLILDAMVVTASAFVFKDIDRALYAGIAVFVASFVLDIVLYGRDGAKLIYIISDKSEQITQRLLAELEIGVTYINGKGAYSGKDKKVIMCVMRKQLAPRTEDIIKEEDPEAFMIVSSATEI
ncbi:MAG: YitT family protein, partial [Lachnospiraceae bacterium]|nr:YitT family protein [Lachnospiraceae bacterium]